MNVVRFYCWVTTEEQAVPKYKGLLAAIWQMRGRDPHKDRWEFH